MIRNIGSKRLLYAFAIPGWLALAFLVSYDFYLIGARPTSPDPAAGYIHPLVAHGPPVYIRTGEAAVLIGALVVALAALAVAAYFQNRAERDRR